MQQIKLNLGDQSYPICIAQGLSQSWATQLETFNSGQKWVLLTQSAIYQLYQQAIENLIEQGFDLEVILVADNESAKNIREAEKVWQKMIETGCDRSSVLIAFGGGVVGDLGGFVAATYMRGIPVVQIPSTLLAMVDSAIGGKTAINLDAGKNLVGAMHQPSKVLVDPDLLATLPKRNVVSSLAEVIKYGLIRDASIFESVEQNLNAVQNLKDWNLITELIVKSCAIKAQIVENDAFEHGERRLLNFGHTIGHAFETAAKYKLYHGEAVMYGMRCASHISFKKQLISEQLFQRVDGLLSQFSLPKLPDLSEQKILDLVARDKKMINGKLNFILLKDIGEAQINTEVTSQEIVDSFKWLQTKTGC